jgi:hypothetical protein
VAGRQKWAGADPLQSMDNSFHHAVDSQLFPGHHRAMQPGAIAGSITRYADLLEVMLPARLEGLRPDEGVDLANFAFDLIVSWPWVSVPLCSSFP